MAYGPYLNQPGRLVREEVSACAQELQHLLLCDPKLWMVGGGWGGGGAGGDGVEGSNMIYIIYNL